MGKDKMKKRIVYLMGAAVILCLWSVATARADEVDELKRQLKQHKQKTAELEKRITHLEIQRKLEEPAVDLPDSLKWLEQIKISGDLRYRHEHIDEETGTTTVGWKNGSDRHRIRARLMLEAMVNDEWDLAFRLASGSKDPVSANQDLEDSFSSKDFWLDLAYFNWHPKAIEGLNVVGGKVKNPFYKVGKNQLVWDGDLNPEGLVVQLSTPFNGEDELFFNGGGFWVDESSSGVDTSLWGAQTYIKHQMDNSDYFLGGASYWDYGNIQGSSDLKSTWTTPGSFFGNTSAAGLFASDYDIFELFGEYGFKCDSMPVTFYGDWVQNLVASTDRDKGWLVGCKLNKATTPGSWEASYDYRVLEADAVVGAMSDSDFIGGGTDGRGHRFGLKYQLAKNVQAATTYFHNEDDTGSAGRDLDYRRLQCDLVLKF